MDNLKTYEELADLHNVTVKTVKRWIADADLEPIQVVQGTGGRPRLLFDKLQLDDALVKLADLKLVTQLSDVSKIKFMIGHIELEGTEEQREAIRSYIDSLHAQLVQKEVEIKQLVVQRDRSETIAINNAAEYNKLLRLVPDSKLTSEQVAWKRVPTADEFCKKFGIR